MEEKYLNMRQMWFPTYDNQIEEYLHDSNDYIRYSTIGLALMRIKNEQIKGDIAEAGVFRGDLSRFIHRIMPDRTYYLFDTFQGFPKKDLENKESDDRFNNTSIDIVKQNIGNLDNINFRIGYFPDTAKGLEHNKFSFVMLDMDLYAPTLAGLEFFYKRLSPGGYLFVHDYNSAESEWACNKVVNKFMSDKKEYLIEIPDVSGTVMFRKNRKSLLWG